MTRPSIAMPALTIVAVSAAVDRAFTNTLADAEKIARTGALTSAARVREEVDEAMTWLQRAGAPKSVGHEACLREALRHVELAARELTWLRERIERARRT